MKLAKMSMVAALLLGANVYAIDNVKVNGDAKVNYHTEDQNKKGATTADMFNSAASAADAALHLGLTADLTTGVSAGVSMTAVSTLGLENNLVNNTWSSAHSVSANPNGGNTALGNGQVDDAMWVDEVWIAATAGKTTAKVGRQALDTPLAFTETWGIDTNTFEGVVLLNQDIADTTLVGAYIGKSNGSAGVTAGGGTGISGYVNEGGKFDSFYNGAYAAGIINNSIKPLTIQAWYYNVQTVASAYWLQADVDMDGILVGGQYVSIDPQDAGVNAYLGATGTDYKDDSAYAVMLGYAVKDVVTVKAAYSSVDDEGTLGVANLATSTKQSKLYTEMFWNYDQVSATGTDSWSITAEGTVSDTDLFVGYYSSETDTVATNDEEVTEIVLTASRSYGALDATVAVIYDEFDKEGGLTVNDTEDATALQVYLTYNF